MKVKYIWMLLLVCFCRQAVGQSWQQTGTANLQIRVTGIDTEYRFNMGAKGMLYAVSKTQLNTLIPKGYQHQQLQISKDSTNHLVASDPITYGKFVYTDPQLARAFAAGAASQLQIFNSFKRYSHGNHSNNIPYTPLNTNSWTYDTTSNQVKSTFNAPDALGFFSLQGFAAYKHDVTFSANIADNDIIGIVLAFMEDSTNMVTNYAYGLNPASFNWPIDVTHPTIPNQHSLIAIRNRNGNVNSWTVFYDYLKATQQTVVDGSNLTGLYNTSANWTGVTVDVEAVRDSNNFVIKTTDFSDAPGGKGSLRYPLSFTLNDLPILAKFKGAKPYGYMAGSVQNATFSNIFFSGSSNVVYDLRNGYGYQFQGTGYLRDTTKDFYNDYGSRFLWRNQAEKTFGYILPGRTYDVIVPAAN